MKILGIRTAPTQLRYALVTKENDDLVLLNADSENLIKVPASIEEYSDMIAWQKEEVDRIIRQNSDIVKVVLKIAEYGRTDTKSNRLGSYFDAAVILATKAANIPIESKLYSQLGTTRSKVKGHAETRVGRTTKYWNEQIADGIIAAWSARGEL